MAIFRNITATFALTIGMVFVAGSAAASQQCRHSAAEYAQVIRHFESEAAKARALAAPNPLLERDGGYNTSARARARSCFRNLAPVTTASR